MESNKQEKQKPSLTFVLGFFFCRFLDFWLFFTMQRALKSDTPQERRIPSDILVFREHLPSGSPVLTCSLHNNHTGIFRAEISEATGGQALL